MYYNSLYTFMHRNLQFKKKKKKGLFSPGAFVELFFFLVLQDGGFDDLSS